MPLWLAQGKDFARRKRLWDMARETNGRELVYGHAGKEFLQAEARTLEQRYRPGDASNLEAEEGEADEAILTQISERCDRWRDMNMSSAALYEEQERELAPEIEQERQLERPEAVSPSLHSVHPHVREFVRTGQLSSQPGSVGAPFVPAFDMFRNTTARGLIDMNQLPRSVLATRDFVTTANLGNYGDMDDYIRPVQWILTNGQKDGRVSIMLLLSPFEANALLGDIAKSEGVVLRLFAPRINQALAPLDHLSLYTVPSGVPAPQGEAAERLLTELVVLSGQLYFSSAAQYQRVCGLLGLGDDVAGHEDSSVSPRESPVKFLRAVVGGMIRCGQGIKKTHVGRILEGGTLENEEFSYIGEIGTSLGMMEL